MVTILNGINNNKTSQLDKVKVPILLQTLMNKQIVPKIDYPSSEFEALVKKSMQDNGHKFVSEIKLNKIS